MTNARVLCGAHERVQISVSPSMKSVTEEGKTKSALFKNRSGGAEKNAERDEDDAAPHGVKEHVAKALAFAFAAADGIGRGHAGQEGEAGLNSVVQPHAGPLDVRLVPSEEMPEEARREGSRNAASTEVRSTQCPFCGVIVHFLADLRQRKESSEGA